MRKKSRDRERDGGDMLRRANIPDLGEEELM